MVGRGEVTDKAWEHIAPLLPENGGRGGQWQDHRKVVNGILWKLRTGAPWWRDLPSRYGPWQTCYGRFVRWRRDGTWDRFLVHAQTKSDAMGEVEWEVSADSTTVRAHQHASGASREPRRRGDGSESSPLSTLLLAWMLPQFADNGPSLESAHEVIREARRKFGEDG